MAGDFATNIKLLQNFPDTIEITLIVARAKAIISWEFRLLSSQIATILLQSSQYSRPLDRLHIS